MRPAPALRWRNLTSNLLATAIILVAGLGLGREAILSWWKVRAPEPPVSTMEAEGAAPDFQLSKPSERWQSAAFVGSREAAVQELGSRSLAAAQRLANSGHTGAPLPASLIKKAQRLLGSGQIEVYLADDELPLVAAVQTIGDERRVLCWGLGTNRSVEDEVETETSASGEWTLTIVAAQDSAPPGELAP